MNISTITQINQYFNHTQRASLSNLQIDSSAYRTNDKQQSVTVEYSSIEAYHDHLIYAALQQSSVFEALKLVREVGGLNSGEGLPENYVREIKMSFIKKDRQQKGMHFSKNENSNPQKESVENKVSYLEKQTSFTQKETVKNEISNIKMPNIETPFAGVEFHNAQRGRKKAINSEKIHRDMTRGYMSMLTNNIQIESRV